MIEMTTQKNAYIDVNPVIVTRARGIAFLCKIVDGESKPGAKVDEVKSFSEAETKKVKIAFDHGKTVKDAFFLLRNKCSAMKSVL